ncbi:unnamed protein product [Camellia sinensis]
MERGTVRLRAMVVMVMVIVVSGMGVVEGQSPTPFMDCYVGCFILCNIIPSHTAYGCALQCLKDCVVPTTTQGIHGDKVNHQFCKLGCASSLCSNISTKQNPGGEKVESCVNSCSEGCTKNYLLP